MEALMRFKLGKRMRFLLCIILVIALGLFPAAKIFATITPTQYVCDVKLYECETSSGSKEEARAYFESIGYVLADAELNPGTDTDMDCYMGYQLTTNRDMAITDIRVLPMDTGYEIVDYNELLEYLKKQNYGIAYTMNSAASEFVMNYEYGSPKAQQAYEGLNLFYVPKGNSQTKLGDYILQGGGSVDFFAEMMVKSSFGTLNAVMGYLNVGIAPYNNEYDEDTDTEFTRNWAEAIPHSELWAMIDSGLSMDETDQLHKLYNDDAKTLFKQLQDFVTCYENAVSRYNANPDHYTEEGEKLETVSDVAEQVDVIEAEDTDAAYITAFEILNQYDFNENMRLGDWLLYMGKQTADEVDLIQFYPVLDAMSDAQVGIATAGGFFTAVMNLGDNVIGEEFEETLPEIKEAIYDYNGGDAVSIWDNRDEDMENATIAYTSDAIRQQQASNTFGKRTRSEIEDEKLQLALKWIDMGVTALFFVVIPVVHMLIYGGAYLFASIFGCCITGFLAGLSSVCSVLNYVGAAIFLAVIAFTAFYALFSWIGKLIDGIDKSKDHTVKPEYVFDVVTTADKTDYTVKYRSVTNSDGEVGDINCAKQWRWCILCTTEDTNVGSPICADENGNIFKMVTGSAAPIDGYSSMRYFGEGAPANCNSYCDTDKQNGCYIHYRTEQSIENERGGEDSKEDVDDNDDDDDTKSEETYISMVIVGTGKTVAEAKAMITRKSGAYYTLDYNLTPDIDGLYTYIGYSLTTDRSQAVTDIRVATYQGTGTTLQYGDITYVYTGNIGYPITADNENTNPQCDALYFTRDENAGSPITPERIHFVRSTSEARDGWEPVSLFCGMPYDFNTEYHAPVDGDVYVSGISTKTQYYFDSHNGVYVYFEPEESYASGERYLSGIFFIGGYSIKGTKKRNWGQAVSKFSNLLNKVNEDPHTYIVGGSNLAKTIYDINMGDGNYENERYLCYTWTYNPKRALYNAFVFQGNTYSNSFPYAMSRMASDGASYIGYTACSSLEQQNVHDLATSWFIHPDNAFINSYGMLVNTRDRSTLMDGWIKDLPEGYSCSFNGCNFLPAALYVCGHTADFAPLKLSDVVISNTQHTGTSSDHKITYEMSGEATLSGAAASGDFHGVYEIKDPYTTKPFNLGFPTWYDDDDDAHDSTSLYMYLGSAAEEKGAYISSISVGSMSRALYKEKAPGLSDSELKAADYIGDIQAMAGAISGCSGEVIKTPFGPSENHTWFKWRYETTKKKDFYLAETTPPENEPVSYIGITRTNDVNKAIRGILLYRLDETTAPAKIKVEGVTYNCANIQVPIWSDGEKYFLYTSTGKGALPGLPLKELIIDYSPLTQGYATALTGDPASEDAYGDIRANTFIHVAYEHQAGEFYDTIYIGTGLDRKEALCDLLTQECIEFVDFDMNKDVYGGSVYMGYRSSYVDWEKAGTAATAAAKQKIIDSALNTAVYDILITVDEPYQANGFVSKDNIYYYPATDNNLNYMVLNRQGSELYLYYASPFWSSRYNSDNRALTILPNQFFSGPITQFAFARNDRVPYNTSLASTADTDGSVLKWEYVMQSDYSAPVDLNAGMATIYNEDSSKFVDTMDSGTIDASTDGQIVDVRLTMFVHRSQYGTGIDSVTQGEPKASAQITGGFLSSTMDVGEMKLNK